MKSPSSLRAAILVGPIAALLAQFAAPSAQAVSYYWDGDDSTAGFGTASGTWAAPTAGTLTSGWSTDSTGATVVDANSVTTTTTDALNFGNGATGLGAGTITVSGTVDAGTITFASGSGAIGLSGGTMNLAAAATITVDNASDSISSVLAGATTSLTKLGTGTLTLTNANTYTGATIINEGTLKVTYSGDLNAGVGPFAVGSGITVNSGGTLLGSAFNGLGSGTTHAGDLLTINKGGALRVDAGTVLSMPYALNVVGGTISSVDGGFSGLGTIYYASTSGTFTSHSDGTAATISALNFNLQGAAFNVTDGNGAVDLNVTGSLIGGLLTKNGNGVMALSTANSYGGVTTINAGTLLAANNTALGVGGHDGATMTFINDGATLALQGGISLGARRHLALPGLRRSWSASPSQRHFRASRWSRLSRNPWLRRVRLNVKTKCMISRPFWLERIENCWRKAPIVWLSGVRRAGKTTLADSLDDAEFVNCDLPSSQQLLADPEAFYRSLAKPRLILDEVHQLPDPSWLLKIGADAFPKLKILATGSSTLAATHKFRDSLAGRKRNLHLVPVRHDELPAFGIRDLRHRLFRGGLPPALLAAEYDPGFYAEWLDSYYARDVQELFRIEKRGGFLKLVESVLRLSGGQMEATALSQLCGLSRPTVLNYLDVLELTHVATFIRPYSGGGKRELVRQSKVYGFDTGFVAFARGWTDLRPEDCGLLWEHVVLDRLVSDPMGPEVMYWRDKDQHEIDFVLPAGRGAVDAIECKWNAERFEPKNLQVFRARHPAGRNLVVATNVPKPYTRELGGLTVTITSLDDLALCR